MWGLVVLLVEVSVTHPVALPTYLSLATTIKRSSLRVTDRVGHEQK